MQQNKQVMTSRDWKRYPVFQQVLMIGTEFARARQLLKQNDRKHTLDCYERAYELLDLTVENSSGSFRKEILEFREYFGNLYLKPNSRMNLALYKLLLTLDPEAFNAIDFKKI